MKEKYRSKPEGEWNLASDQDQHIKDVLERFKIQKNIKHSKEFIEKEIPKREPTNRERLLAVMAKSGYAIDYFQNLIDHPEQSEHPGNDYRPIVRLHTYIYTTLHNLIMNTEFQSADIDEVIALLVMDLQKASSDKKEALEETLHVVNNSYHHWNPTINETSHYSLYSRSTEIPKENVRQALGYKRYVNGSNLEILGLIPIDEKLHKPLYIGTHIRYKTKSGDIRDAKLTGFTLPISARGARDEHIYGVDIENDTPISLCTEQIIDVSSG